MIKLLIGIMFFLILINAKELKIVDCMANAGAYKNGFYELFVKVFNKFINFFSKGEKVKH